MQFIFEVFNNNNFDQHDVLNAVHELILCDNKDVIKPKKLK